MEIKNKIKVVATRVKDHVVTHKAAYAFGGLAVTAIALQKKQSKEFDKFLTSKGIDPMEFYLPEAFQVTV